MNLAELIAAHDKDRPRADLARALGVKSSNTIKNWGEGKTRMPRHQAAKIAEWLGKGVTERAVIAAAAESQRQFEATHKKPAAPVDVLAAIKADPNLLPEAKRHLISQYALLLRITGTPTTAPGDPESLAKNALLVEGAEKAKRMTGAKSRPNG